jgi:hypothetical protein
MVLQIFDSSSGEEGESDFGFFFCIKIVAHRLSCAGGPRQRYFAVGSRRDLLAAPRCSSIVW